MKEIMKKKTERQLNRELHYKFKLQYKLIHGSERLDIALYRKHLLRSKTLAGVMLVNENWLYVNPLGIKTDRTTILKYQ
ncbi:hypothetical protein M089_5731 [Bacteroides ovatus str. 3725 D9 iii]|jgi:hypothetical protein|uniref:Uncharacterized protein n=1 Tax=Bacteroides ovatus TaxID=28116 RepID=A0AAP9DQZ6_BACOV|nr:hypothetical protein [Bacteroides ovatus]KDS13451.1 hypothetical protein M082_5817 [Bacteroides fragilis str. 3725 D9 ii]KDS15636.1 hypothetical protein M089_5731 [Bacteroides ovatus str. 3725 D9 iii]QDM12878.1 hypothetical protein DYI28_29770 [Bacteroides ovatus]